MAYQCTIVQILTVLHHQNQIFIFQESDNITAPLRLVEIFSDLKQFPAEVSVTLFRVLVSNYFSEFGNYFSDIHLTSSSQPFETLWSTDKNLKVILLTEGSEIQQHLKSGHFQNWVSYVLVFKQSGIHSYGSNHLRLNPDFNGFC